MIPVSADRDSGEGRDASLWVLAGGACVGLASFLYYYVQGMTVAHYDAKAHLVVARRLVDSVSPGYQQMGANWLPLIHLVYLPFVLIESQYRSAVLPSLISVCAFALSGWAVFRIARRVTGSTAAGVFGAVVLIANSNLEYLQSCPLTEPLSIMFIVLAVDALLKWRADPGNSLPWQTAIWATLAALCRYEGLFLLCGILALLAWDWWSGLISRKQAGRAALVYLGVFALPAIAHFGAIYFLAGDTFFHRVARGNPEPYVTWKRPLLSLVFHLGELTQAVSVLALLVAVAGMAVVLSRRTTIRQFLPLFLLWLPSLTNIAALYWGLIYRVRYSVLLVPAVAVFSALLVTEVARRRAFMAGCLVAMTLPWLSWCFPYEWRFHDVMPGPGSLLLPAAALVLFLAAEVTKLYRWPLLALTVFGMQIPALQGEYRPILEETGEHAFIEPERQQLLEYLRLHHDGSPILIDMGKLAPLAYDSGLPLRNFIYNEGDGLQWHRALLSPDSEVGWLCAEKGDEVWEWLRIDPRKAAGYSVVLRTENFLLYRRHAVVRSQATRSPISMGNS